MEGAEDDGPANSLTGCLETKIMAEPAGAVGPP